MTAQILAMSNLKGGVGKSVTAGNVAAALALGVKPVRSKLGAGYRNGPGRKVLAVDLDQQTSLSDALRTKAQEGRTFAAALSGADVDFDDAIYEPAFDLPSGTLHVLSTTEYDQLNANAVFQDLARTDSTAAVDLIGSALAPIAEDYDYIVIDTRPELSFVTASAMAACDGVVFPVTSDITTAIHLPQVFLFFDWVLTTATNSNAQALGIVRSRWEKGFESGQTDELLSGYDRAPTFTTVIPAHKNVSKAFMMTSGPSVLSFPNAPSTKRFCELTAEMIRALERLK